MTFFQHCWDSLALMASVSLTFTHPSFPSPVRGDEGHALLRGVGKDHPIWFHRKHTGGLSSGCSSHCNSLAVTCLDFTKVLTNLLVGSFIAGLPESESCHIKDQQTAVLENSLPALQLPHQIHHCSSSSVLGLALPRPLCL